MTGKRPRALTRTASVSQLGSGSLSQEFSPLVENPKEKLKVSGGGVVGKEVVVAGVACARRVVIGFDPKPAGCEFVSPKSAPCSPCFVGGGDDASSPRSVLGSLFSRQQRCAKPSDGVGLGIALHEVKKDAVAVKSDHIAIPVREDVVSPPREAPGVAHSRRHSHPIPTPGISACHFSSTSRQEKPAVKVSVHVQQPAARPVLGWLEQDAVKVDRRDTFLLGASPSRSLVGLDAGAALTASSHFLDECSFCKRHLPEDKDIFMYRGDKAFCSVECRSQQMLMDERSKNCSSSAFKRTPGSVAPTQRTRVAPASSVAAA